MVSTEAMGAIRYLAGRGLRASRGGWLLVLVLTTVTVGVSTGAVRVGRATLQAHPRLMDAVDAPDVTLGIGNPDNPEPGSFVSVDQLRALDGIARVDLARSTLGTQVDDEGRLDPSNTTGLIVALEGTPTVPVLRGRWPADDTPDEVAISTGAARLFDVDLGDRITYAVLTFAEVDELMQAGADRGGTTVDPVVVGIVGSTAIDGPPEAPTDGSLLIAGPAFLDAHPGVGTYQIASVWLQPGATMDALLRELEIQFGPTLDVTTRTEVESSVRRAVRPEAIAITALGFATALAGLVITAQAIARQLGADRDSVTLLAIGVSRRQRAAERWLQVALTVVVGTTIGLVAAIVVADRLGAVGVADAFDHLAVADPEVTIAALGATAMALALGALALVSAWRGAAALPGRVRTAPSLIASLAARAPMWVRTSVTLTDRRSGTASAARAAIAGTATSVIAVVAIITFGSSLDALVSTPAMYGQDYDLSAWDGYNAIDDDEITETLLADDDVDRVSRTAVSGGTVDGRETELMGLDDLTIGPSRTSGRDPAATDEVLLGRRLARRLRLNLGDDVVVAVGGQTERYEVVGTGVVPASGGDGAVFTLDGLRRVAPEAPVGSQLVRLRDDAHLDAVVGRFNEVFGCQADCELTPPSPPTDIAYLDRVSSLPEWSAAAMVAVGVAMTIHALVLVARRSRRAVAVLRSIGATRRQAARCLFTQATVIVGVAVVVGLVLGLVAGRAVWQLFANELGVVPTPQPDLGATASAVTGLIALALVVASVPSWLTARRPPAVALRAG
ncbi:MAG: FtsX-like permease family protein [Microthrixaceae bacterium]